MKTRLRYIVSAVFILISIVGYGQNNTLNFKHLTLDEGLSQSTINCILQDKKGFIWLGTRGGLNRYDGTNFKVFLHNPSDSTSLSNNIIYALHEDSLGRIWVGTQDGLSIFDHSRQAFTVVRKTEKSQNGLSHNTIKAITQDVAGHIWIGTYGGGINKVTVPESEELLSADNLKFQTYLHNTTDESSLSSNFVTSLAVNGKGEIWVGTASDGLNKLDTSSGEFLHYFSKSLVEEAESKINTLYLDRQQNLWVGTADGIRRLISRTNSKGFRKNERIIKYTHRTGDPTSLSNNAVISILQGASGLIWIGTDGGGLNKFSKRTGKFTQYFHDVNEARSIISNNVRCIFDDVVGILWLGTNSGVSQLGISNKKFKIYQRDGADPNTISSNYVQALYKELNGTTWVGTFDGGLNRINGRTGKVTQYKTTGIYDGGIKRVPPKPVESKKKKRRKRRKKKQKPVKKISPPKNLSDMRVLALHRDRRNTLWIGTGGGGLNKLNLVNERITHYKANPIYEDSLSNNTIRVIYEDRSGIIWIGTEGGGLNRFDRRKFKHYIKDSNNKESITNNDVRAIAQDKKGDIWVGTYGGGLNRFDPKSEKFTAVKQEIASDIIFCLRVDANGILWIGTSEGLTKYDIENNQFKSFSMQDGLPNNLVYGILDDSKGNLWLSTNKGLSRFNIEKEEFNNYDRKDGLQSNEFVPGAFSKSRNGELLFGGISGYNSFYPTSVKDNPFVPEVIITDFKILNKPVVIGGPDSPLSKDISETKEITLSYKDAVFSFEFVALNFTNADKTQYAYMMENFDPEWNHIGNRSYVNYTNLEPGNYVFRVKASNNDGIWNEEGTSLRIKILPPFWETWWFKCISFFGFLFLSFLLYKIRVKRIEYKKNQLEKEVADRTAEVVSQRDELAKKKISLEKKKKEIEEQNFLLAEKTEEILAQRNNIEEKNKQLEKAWDEVLKANNELKKSNTSLEEKVNERTAKLREAVKDLVRSNQELDTFLYRASHDLKGPITRLLGLTQLAKLDDENGSGIDYIDIIENSSIDMNKTLNKLINIHSINTKPLKSEVVNMEALYNRIKKPLENEIKAAKIKIDFNYNEDGVILCDEELLKIILENLMENAIMFKAPSKPRIILSIATSTKRFVMKIEDNGLGIDTEYKDRIFDMFFRGSEISQGNGLGLYLVKKAIDKLGGKIQVESEEGKFTAFSISIPRNSKNQLVPAHIV